MLQESNSGASLLEALQAALGPEAVSSKEATRRLFSEDVFRQSAPAAFVVRPRSIEEAQAAIALAHRFGAPLIPRGAGMSYTQGYAAGLPQAGVLDLSGLTRILALEPRDMFVTVEAGLTWAQLREALKPHGLRTPFWGPLSGLTSTIGGGLSQHNAFFGAGVYGASAESVLALGVVLADGTLVRTASAGAPGAKPFFRHYGPDLTGLFLGDCGALGHKVEATLRLIPAPEHEACASFAFASRDSCAEALAEAARQGLACEAFGFDPALARIRLERASLSEDAKTLGKVVASRPTLLEGLQAGAKLALAGRSFLPEQAYSLHLVTEGRSKAGVADALSQLRRICTAQGGGEIESSIPEVVRANPFGPLNSMLGPKGERWVPVHGIVPLSQGPAAWQALEALFAGLRPRFEALGVQTGTLVTTLSTTGFLIEPVFLWPDARFPLHEKSVDPTWLARLPRHPPNPEAHRLVEEAREAAIEVFARQGGAHLQIGRAYPFKRTRSPETWALLQRIKHALDPAGEVNPGCLGFD